MCQPLPPVPAHRPLPVPELKALMLWCARWLTPGGGFYAGRRLLVEVDYDGGADVVTVRPARDASGLLMPAAVQAGPGEGPTAGQLIERFLSDKERAILRALADVGPAKGADLLDAVGGAMSRTEFYAALGGLTVRRLVEEGDDGYDFAVGWVRGLVAA